MQRSYRAAGPVLKEAYTMDGPRRKRRIRLKTAADATILVKPPVVARKKALPPPVRKAQRRRPPARETIVAVKQLPFSERAIRPTIRRF